MDRQALTATLDTHLAGGRLDLPPGALQSDPVRQQLELALGAEQHLVLDPVTERRADADAETVTGTGSNGPFRGMKVTARFTAGEPPGLTLTAEAVSPGWTLDSGFERLQHTLASALQFKDARWRLASGADGGLKPGLSFRGTMDTANSLGLFLFLLGNTDKVLAGEVEVVEEGVPGMRIEGYARKGTQLGFLGLGPVRLALVTHPVPPVREGGPNQAAVLMEVSTSIDFDIAGEQRPLPLKAGIYTDSSAIRIDADTTQLVGVGLHELSALVNSVELGGLSFGEFQLEKVVKVTQLTLMVDPEAETKLTNVTLTVESAQSWKLLSRDDGSPFLTLQNIRVRLGIAAPFTPSKLSAALRGELELGTGRIIIEALVAPRNVRLRGYLDNDSSLSLREVAAHFLGDEARQHTPELLFSRFNLVVEPGRSYELAARVSELWTIKLGDAELHLKSVSADWRYVVGGKAEARLDGRIQLGGADIDLHAKYETDGGWDFSGGLAEGQNLNVGHLLGDLLYYFGVEPPAFVEGIHIDTLSVESFNPTKGRFKFTIGGGLPVEEKFLGIVLKADIKKKDGEFELELCGTVTIGGMQFEMAFVHDAEANSFIATYAHTGAPQPILLRKFVAEHLSASVAEAVPEKLEVDIKDVLFAFTAHVKEQTSETTEERATPSSKFLFALDLSASVSLSDLPLVGQKFPREQTVGLEGLRLMIATTGLTRREVETFERLLPPNIKKLSVASERGTKKTSEADTEAVIPKGLTVSAVMNFGGAEQPLSLPVGPKRDGGETPEDTTKAPSDGAAPVTSSDQAKWFAVQKSFGPVSVEKVGVKYQDAALWFLLNASLSAAGLTLTLDGLALHSPLKSFRPEFELRGLGIAYKGGAVEIGGALLRISKRDSGKAYDEYVGAALIKAKQLALSALGSYAELDGHMSLFVYAVLDYPLGGPSFFFVTGLAAGFGYNRSLLVPAVDEVSQFPLVADAVTGAGMPRDLAGKLASMQRHVPPAVGQSFFAVGIKFTSFKVINSFALLTVTLGTQFEVNLLGLSTLTVPAAGSGQTGPPLAEVQMALRAAFNPARGFLGVEAQLTPDSYILSRDCHLTGGFAFYSWFGGARKEDDEHKGDFVLTLGGYHPNYRVPAHYPRVPRVGFNWRVSDKLSLKGGVYYALTAAAQMAGGSLEATWDGGDIKAHFKAAVNFIIYWQPYRYDATVSVEIGGSINILGGWLEVNVGADLHIWGPEFAGTAHIDVTICSFDISFGSSAPRKLEPVEWGVFRDSFLPKDKHDRLAVCGISVADGLLAASADDAAVWVVNPKTLTLVTNSVIPSKAAFKATTAIPPLTPTNFGVAPMGLRANDISSSHTINITRWSDTTKKFEPAAEKFNFVPVLKNVPVALWGESLEPDINGPAFVTDTLAGFEVRPKAKPAPGVTAGVDYSALCFDAEEAPKVYEWSAPAPFVADALDEGGRRRAVLTSILNDKTAKTRERLLHALGVNAETEVKLSGYDADAFLIAPQVTASRDVHGTG